jgi:hypothetical protein
MPSEQEEKMASDRPGRALISLVVLLLLCGACPGDDESSSDAGSSQDARSDASVSCDGIPQCRFACPDGTVNPKDQNGCVHSCTCVLTAYASQGPVPLKMYTTCGDPVCGGPRANPDVPMCGTADVDGATCQIEGARCGLGNQCNQLLVCARKDPKAQPGGCPVAFTVQNRDR